MRIHAKVLLATVSAIVITHTAGCGQAATPSEAQARTAYEERAIKQGISGDIKLTSFKKTNGYAVEGMGVKSYVLEYEAVLTYKNGANTSCTEFVKAPDSSFSKDPRNSFLRTQCRMGLKVIEPGQSETVKDKITFIFTENGWTTPK